ncbi:CRTAC1 family protein, partial [bacterium]|nr:CRTAC1 family protein [bacterium]
RFDDGDWLLFESIDDGGPFLFTVPGGVGEYDFYTIARDFLDNAEAAPAEPDITVITTPPYWTNVAPDDGTGVGNDGNGRGAAWGDYNGDGRPDLFITNRPVWFTGADATNHLYRNDGEDLGNPDSWLFLDTTTGVMSDAGYGQGVAWGDFDGDGDLDLYQGNMNVGSPAPNHLFRNDGAGVFTDIGPATGTNDDDSARSVAWVDYDCDGDLDLYLCNDGPNHLYRNDGENPWQPGNWMFTDVAPANGTGVGDDRYTMGCAWGDFDNDGDPDLYLANYNSGANALFRNDGEDVENPGEWLFTNVAAAMGVADSENGLGCAWGDYDGDGWLDLYLTNQGPNRLYHRVPGSELFQEVGAAIGNGLADGNYSGSCSWGDYDNDGDLDLYVGNHWTNPQGDWVPNLLFRNDGAGGPGGWLFVNDAPANGYGVGSGANTTGTSWADFDGDGDLDIYLCNMTGLANELYRNDVPATLTNRWLHLDLVSRTLNTAAIGARVRCIAAGAAMIREVDGGSGFVSQGTLTVEFGLGSATQADTVEIRWPSGIVQTLLDVGADQRLTVMEPGPDIPVIAALPVFTAGDSVVVAWSDESASGATAYQVQVGDDPVFANIRDTSAWIPDTTYVFNGLADGFTGFYRVRARDDEMLVSRWSGTATTTQDGGPPVSEVLPIEIVFQGLPFDIPFSAGDNVSGVARVDLYYRYAEGVSFEYYASSSDGSPILFGLPNGLGEYFFYTVAEDSVGNLEDPPAGYDQTVLVTSSPWVLVSPADGSGVGNDGNGRGTAWGDYDGDGDHDLYISNRISYQSGADSSNHLFRNDGEDPGDPDSWLFPDVTTPPLDDDDYSQGVAWADFDGDGDLDLYMVNMQVNPDYDAPNRLYRNDGGGVFTDIGVQTGTDDPGSGRSCS